MLSALKLLLNYVKKESARLRAKYPWVSAALFGRNGKLVFVGIAIFCIWAVGYGRFYKPVSEKVDRVKKRVEKTETKINEMRSQFPDVESEQDSLEKKDRLVDSIRKRLQSEEERLPNRSELSKVLGQFTSAGTEAKISILAVKPVEEKKRQKGREESTKLETPVYPEEYFQLEMLAAFWELVAYLSRLEQVSPYFSFPRLSIQSGKRGEILPSVVLEVSTLFSGYDRRDSREDLVFREDVESFERTGQERDPFGSLAAETAVKGEESPYKVTGIIWKGGQKVAIIDNEVVREGDEMEGGMSVISIGDQKVVLEENGRYVEIAIP